STRFASDGEVRVPISTKSGKPALANETDRFARRRRRRDAATRSAQDVVAVLSSRRILCDDGEHARASALQSRIVERRFPEPAVRRIAKELLPAGRIVSQRREPRAGEVLDPPADGVRTAIANVRVRPLSDEPG